MTPDGYAARMMTRAGTDADVAVAAALAGAAVGRAALLDMITDQAAPHG